VVRLASVEDRLMDVWRQKFEPQDVAIVWRGWRSLYCWQPALGTERGMGLAQRCNQNSIGLRRTPDSLCFSARSTHRATFWQSAAILAIGRSA
jgi:hypothetical protein